MKEGPNKEKSGLPMGVVNTLLLAVSMLKECDEFVCVTNQTALSRSLHLQKIRTTINKIKGITWLEDTLNGTR